jgi:YfiH family protein
MRIDLTGINGLPDFPVIQPDWTGLPPNVRAFTTTRHGGFSAGHFGAGGSGRGGLNLADHVGDDIKSVINNRRCLNKYLPSNAIFLSQVHGNIAIDVARARPGSVADASFSSEKSLVCSVLTADCLPVLFADTQGNIVAAAHAGWRGLVAGVLQETVQKMRSSGGKEIVAWLGPAIGPSQFEVGSDVLDAFSGVLKNASDYFVFKQSDVAGSDKYLADIYGLARAVLMTEGVEHVFGGIHCTVNEPGNFYSYRREGVTGRMASVIWLD